MLLSGLLFLAVLAGLAATAPVSTTSKNDTTSRNDTISLQAADCNAPVAGLSFEDCLHMNNIGMAGMGDNPFWNNGYIWIGDDGSNRFRFTNTGGVPRTLILWDFADGDYQSSFMNVRRPKISYSLPSSGSSVTISVGSGISLGYATLNNRQTTLSRWGQIFNTWGEATTGNGWPGSATIDVSRLVNMNGNPQSVRVAGCLADMEWCSFQCKNGLSECGESGSYDLLRCTPDVNPDSGTGWVNGNPEGGCYGWDNGGDIYINLGN
ncbi:uncharacterized protein F5Z01DRAFT_498460 [Emericellopsis atlantica]|uniref:Uncharacterized protein n=1 Tax=Emericellopsis atlantica TaxID=2614577 RepID=A0A9P8CSW7_9HYPO|nr:uncharacterized protein F5Z01DRAFT_498460 [Emericellopsis atlantica]KAG9256201.1 hypothetical protein F5Z01DRAFT_498460 [Emericellopsis atlantica]